MARSLLSDVDSIGTTTTHNKQPAAAPSATISYRAATSNTSSYRAATSTPAAASIINQQLQQPEEALAEPTAASKERASTLKAHLKANMGWADRPKGLASPTHLLGFINRIKCAQELFSDVGDLKRYSIHYDRSGRSKGTTEVVFSRRQDAMSAIKMYNNVQLGGKPMKIEIVGTNIATPAMPPAANGVQTSFIKLLLQNEISFGT